MTEHYWTPQSNVSNETSTNKTFQRTISAQVHKNTVDHHIYFASFSHPNTLFLYLCAYRTPQDTLAYATALLNEKEQSGSSNGSDGSPANENADRSLRQVGTLRYVSSCSSYRSQTEENKAKMEPLSSVEL